MKSKRKQGFEINNIDYESYVLWCKENDKRPEKPATKTLFFAKVIDGKLGAGDDGKVIKKRVRK